MNRVLTVLLLISSLSGCTYEGMKRTAEHDCMREAPHVMNECLARVKSLPSPEEYEYERRKAGM